MPAARKLQADASASPEVRGLSAVLRWRGRWLRSQVQKRQALALRFLPVLLHGSFQHPLLRTDAPGIADMKFRPGWGPLANQFELPPPFRIQRGRRMIEALIALSTTSGLDVFVFCPDGLTPQDSDKLRQRVLAAQGLLASAGVALRLEPVMSSSRPPAWVLERVIAFGAMIAGVLPAGLQAPPLAPEDDFPEPGSNLAVDALGTMAPLALTLFGRETAPDPVDAIRDALARNLTARQLADPAVFCSEWVGAATGQLDLLHAAIRHSVKDPHVRLAGGTAAKPETLENVLTVGRDLTLRFLRSARRSPLWADRQLRMRLLKAVLVGGFPRALLPAVESRLIPPPPPAPPASLSSAKGGHLLSTPRFGARPLAPKAPPPPPARVVQPVIPLMLMREQGLWAARRSGVLLGRGTTSEQARVRALSLLALFPQIPPPARTESPWDQVHARLARHEGGNTLLFAVEPTAAPGPPFDPINRGVQRGFGLGPALVVRLAPGRRASAQILTAAEAVERLVEIAARGDEVELIGRSTEAQPAVARLARVCSFVREVQHTPEPETAVQAGGVVLALRPSGIRHYSPARYLSRPRACRPDPESPDLALTPDRPAAPGTISRQNAAVIECRLAQVNELVASVLFVDSEGRRMREEISLAQLDGYLRDVQALLRACPAPTMLAVIGSAQLEQMLRRVQQTAQATEVTVLGELPFGLAVDVSGERFGRGSELGWSAAALTCAAAWPPDERGRISVKKVLVSIGGNPVFGIAALYARSVAVRRLEQQIQLQLFPYR